ncbi:TAT-variant-translocated molybdopterin oxidoreductase [bacterium]|nr:TAT-variant-translocated molybdopterin oxidoreductase [bacterium]
MSVTSDEQTAAPRGGKPRSALDLPALRARLEAQSGKHYWRSLDELADSEEFQSFLQAEFPAEAQQALDPVGRRTFIKLMGASLALAGVSACTKQPTETVFPYVKAPEYIVPGEPLYFATAMPLDGIGRGLLVESHMGRPTKIEGNPDHPASLGATDVLAQASVLGLYDPDRSQVVRYLGEVQTWRNFATAASDLLAKQQASGGAGLRILSGNVSSPTTARLMGDLLAKYPQATWHRYQPINNANAQAAMRTAFGRPLDVQYRFDKADRILSLDADFLGGGPGMVRYAKDFTRRRKLDAGGGAMNRLYVVETSTTNTGAKADHRQPLRPAEIAEFALGVARGLGLPVRAPVGMEGHQALITAVVRDLQAHKGRSIVLAGEWQPPVVHLLAAAINTALGADGSTVLYTEPVVASPVDETQSLRDLVAAMQGGAVEVLVLLDVNPVYDAPVDLEFTAALDKVPTRIHHGLYYDETGILSHWHLPATHYLEDWGDVRAYDGTASIQQPLIAPLYDGRGTPAVLSVLLGQPDATTHDLVRETWKNQLGGDFEKSWRKAVHDGVIANTAATPVQPNWVGQPADWSRSMLPPPAERPAGAVDVVFRPDSSLYDGRFANNGWLQEVPKHITRVTWDNPALIAPATAERLGLDVGALVEVTLAGRTLQVPVWIQPGHAPDAITLGLGFGRPRAGQVGNDVGFNTYLLRTADAPWSASDASLVPLGRHYKLACTQDHHSMHGRNLVRTGTVEQFEKKPTFARTRDMRDKSLYPGFKFEGHAWGMTVDIGNCIGCNACVVACQAENNIPVVGKDQVARGREMQWIRIDRYFEGDLDNPQTVMQPVFCQHCEQAPCEGVCPVNATVHDTEGINAMVYNRCVGTRYCSNNCPYKVRRFNFTLYNDPQSDVHKMVFNPDVTVRSRGVMEKCTYCIQRINYVRIKSKRENRPITDGEVLTACQQVCPADALTFGDINDPEAAVTKNKQDPRNYSLLNELGTLPRTTYLAGIRNPNPDLARG